MDLSIIIPSYNTKELLERCLASVLESLRSSSISYEIIVIDNRSTDGSVQMVTKEYPSVILIENKENIGYGRANNKAIRKARGTYTLLLNSDTVTLDDAVSALYNQAVLHPNSFVGATLLNEDRSLQPSCGPFYSLPIVCVMLFFKGDRFGVTRYSPRMEREVDWVSGACIMGKTEHFVKVGLFDEDIFMYMEEIDLLYRAKQKGYTCVFTPAARLIHTGAASSGDKRAPVVNIYRGLLYFYKKHYSRPAYRVLQIMLRIKAGVAIGIGKLLGNRQLVTIYEKAYRFTL